MRLKVTQPMFCDHELKPSKGFGPRLCPRYAVASKIVDGAVMYFFDRHACAGCKPLPKVANDFGNYKF